MPYAESPPPGTAYSRTPIYSYKMLRSAVITSWRGLLLARLARRLVAVVRPLTLDAVLQDPGVLLDLLEGQSLLGVQDQELEPR